MWRHWLACTREPSLGADTGNGTKWASEYCICRISGEELQCAVRSKSVAEDVKGLAADKRMKDRPWERVECEQRRTCQPTLTKSTKGSPGLAAGYQA